MSVSTTPNAIIDIATDADIIDAPTTQYQRIRIHSLLIVGIATVTLKAGTSTPLTGAMVIPAGNPILVLPFSPEGWFDLPERTAFRIATNGQISGTARWSLLGG